VSEVEINQCVQQHSCSTLNDI